MKLIPLLTLVALILSSVCSSAENLDEENLTLEIVWGLPNKPTCNLKTTAEVSGDSLFAVQSKDGQFAAGGKVGLPDEKGYPVVFTIFTRSSPKSHEVKTFEGHLKLGEFQVWATVGGIARLYHLKLSRPEKSDSQHSKK